MTTDSTLRSAFEAWREPRTAWTGQFRRNPKKPDEYACVMTQGLWEAYQACAATMVDALVGRLEALKDTLPDDCTFTEDYMDKAIAIVNDLMGGAAVGNDAGMTSADLVREAPHERTTPPAPQPSGIRVDEAKQQLGAYANILPEHRIAMTFGGLLKCVWQLHRGKEMMGHRCAEILAALLDRTAEPVSLGEIRNSIEVRSARDVTEVIEVTLKKVGVPHVD